MIKSWRFLREPLFHFIVIGGLLFLLFAAVNNNRKFSPDVIAITPQRINQIATGFNRTWSRSPTDEELNVLIENDIRAEVYYRDALALGLDQNDALVRRRLQQKMEFLTDTSAYLKEPSSGELEAYFAANEKNYERKARLAFEQIFLGDDADKAIITRSLDMLQSGNVTEPYSLGKQTLLPPQLRLSQIGAVNSVFGQGFFEQLEKIPPGVWVGPVASAYGVHLVRTLDGVAASTPTLEQVYDAVLKDWRSDKAVEHREQDYAERRKNYIVEIHRDESSI